MKRYFVFAAALLVGCSTINKSKLSSSIDLTIDSPMRAKVDVDMTRKMVGYAYGGYLLNFIKVRGDNKYVDNVEFGGKGRRIFSRFSRVESVKSAATYNAIRAGNADVLVNPQYVIEESLWNPVYKEIKVKVTGYPGTVVAIKNK